MVLRKSDRRFAALVAVCSTAASLVSWPVPVFAQTTGSVYAQSSGDSQMVWGGRLPQPGETYRPSVGRQDGLPPTYGGAMSPPNSSPAGYGNAPAVSSTPAADDRRLLDDLLGGSAASPAPASGSGTGTNAGNLAPPALAAPVTVRSEPRAGVADLGADAVYQGAASGGENMRRADPWSGLKAVTPPSTVPSEPRGRVASLGAPSSAPQPPEPQVTGRGAQQPETPEGYILLPKREAMCRVALKKMGVKYTDISPIHKGGSCGIPHPIKVTQITDGVAVKPAATLNCDAAFRISKWVEDEVKPAARWRLWTSPTAVLNASSYRCSRIAGSRTISEHASGNALDVRGFEFSNGDVFDVEKKGFFSFRQKGFQKSVRHSACEHFGTVLGPGYNYDHRDHLHLDAKNRRRGVCK